jgi:hypothetical protein
LRIKSSAGILGDVFMWVLVGGMAKSLNLY